jgi:hypothetical protein
VGKIARHCDPGCDASRNFAHALASHAEAQPRQKKAPR